MQTHDEMEKRRKEFLEKGFELFSEKSIEAVTLQNVADASGHGIATLYRYFTSKSHFLVEMASWKWGEFFKQNRKRRPSESFDGMTAAEMLEFYLDSFLEVYRNHRQLLKFNQLFNVYLRSEGVNEEHQTIYLGLMKPATDLFHLIYEKAKLDNTVRTDIPESEMLSTTLHLMLAAVTRYAVGLVYEPKEGFDDMKELETLKELLMMKYMTR